MLLLERLRGLVGRTVGVPDREEDPMVSASTAQTRKLAHSTAPGIVQSAPGNGEQYRKGWPSDAPRELDRNSRNSARVSFWRAVGQVLSEGEEVCVQYEGCGFRVTGIAGDAKRPMLRLQGRSSAILLGAQSIRYTGSTLEKGGNGKAISPTIPSLSTRRNDRAARTTGSVDTLLVINPLTPDADPSIRNRFCAVLQNNAKGHVIEVDGQPYQLVWVTASNSMTPRVKVRDEKGEERSFGVDKVTIRYVGASVKELAVFPKREATPSLDSELLDRTIEAIAENRRLVALAAAQAVAKATTEGAVPGGPTLSKITRLGADSTGKDVQAFCASLKPDRSIVHFRYDGRGGGERTGTFLYPVGATSIRVLSNGSEKNLNPNYDDIWILE